MNGPGFARHYLTPELASSLESSYTGASLLPEDMYTYELSTVVTHEGRLDNGHYWADVRAGCEWFHCDDDKSESFSSHHAEHVSHISNWYSVTPTTLSQVLSQKAYILFYNKRSVAYEVKA